MSKHVLAISDAFWNIRGSFKIGGWIDIGTHASLVRRANGRFVFLDSYTFKGETAREIARLTNNGNDVEAVLNLHPFHTVHVPKMVEQFPNAKHFGTARHLAKFPDLPWETARVEDSSLHQQFAEDFEFSIPHGVDFISRNEHLHFSSVIALHRASKTIHVDDTLMCFRPPRLLRSVGVQDIVRFHPTLAKVLERRAGATHEFRKWANDLTSTWHDARNLCAAHTAALTESRNSGPSIAARIQSALSKVEPILARHEKTHG